MLVCYITLARCQGQKPGTRLQGHPYRCKMAAFGVSEEPVDDEAATFDAVRLVFKGDADGLQALLDKKPNAAKGHDDTFNDATALHVAVGETQPACARALLNAGADANTDADASASTRADTMLFRNVFTLWSSCSAHTTVATGRLHRSLAGGCCPW